MRILKLDLDAERARDAEALTRFMGLSKANGDALDVKPGAEPGTFEITGISFAITLAMNPEVTTPREMLRVNMMGRMAGQVAEGVRKSIELLTNDPDGHPADVFIMGGFAQGIVTDAYQAMTGHSIQCVQRDAVTGATLGFAMALEGMALVRANRGIGESEPVAREMRDLANGKAAKA